MSGGCGVGCKRLLTLLDAEAAGPLLQGDVLVVVSVALLEEARGAVLHGNEGGAQGRQLAVRQVAVSQTSVVQSSADVSTSTVKNV